MSDEREKKIFSSNLNKYMELYGKTQNDLIIDLGINKSTISTWCSGSKMPRMGTIQTLADYFGILKSDLIEEKTTYIKKGVKIPVLGEVAAGIPIEAIEDIIDYEEITQDMAKTGEFFGLQIKGDSMSPRMESGDVVIVRKQETVENGEIAVVLVNGDSATVKKIRIQKDGIMLIPLNPSHEPFFYSQKEIEELPVRIIGKVVELRGKF